MNIFFGKKNNVNYIQIDENIYNKEILEMLLNVDICMNINIINKLLEEIAYLEKYSINNNNKIMFSHAWNICRINIYATKIIILDTLTDDNDAFCRISVHEFKQIIEFCKQNINKI